MPGFRVHGHIWNYLLLPSLTSKLHTQLPYPPSLCLIPAALIEYQYTYCVCFIKLLSINHLVANCSASSSLPLHFTYCLPQPTTSLPNFCLSSQFNILINKVYLSHHTPLNPPPPWLIVGLLSPPPPSLPLLSISTSHTTSPCPPSLWLITSCPQWLSCQNSSQWTKYCLSTLAKSLHNYSLPLGKLSSDTTLTQLLCLVAISSLGSIIHCSQGLFYPTHFLHYLP